MENFSISQILATNSDGDLQYIENTDNYTINKLGAGETSEVSIYAELICLQMLRISKQK